MPLDSTRANADAILYRYIYVSYISARGMHSSLEFLITAPKKLVDFMKVSVYISACVLKYTVYMYADHVCERASFTDRRVPELYIKREMD